ncbi:hypothetical protein [Marinomonas foliarum]|uniref:Integral membrane protein n=1 Tax=Marinomonas foliarum TaxID=491950 RepID=A0ABX7IKY3_9GAMM|nr:hypothetical protein [Marinomonas foliarum]QRV22977.1 hypothetical protein JSY38_12975 [Marinomonas foliarum]
MERLYYVSLCIQLLLILIIQSDPEYSPVNFLFIPAFFLATFGLIYAKTQKNIFAYISMAGFLAFIPIGILGVIAVRNTMDKESKRKFKERLNDE